MNKKLIYILLFVAQTAMLIVAAHILLILPLIFSLLLASIPALIILEYRYIISLLSKEKTDIRKTLTYRLFFGDLFIAGIVSFFPALIFSIIIIFGTGYGIGKIVIPVTVKYFAYRSKAIVDVQGVEVNSRFIKNSLMALRSNNLMDIIFPDHSQKSSAPDLTIESLKVLNKQYNFVIRNLIYDQTGILKFYMQWPETETGLHFSLKILDKKSRDSLWSIKIEQNNELLVTGEGTIQAQFDTQSIRIISDNLVLYSGTLGLSPNQETLYVQASANFSPYAADINGVFYSNGRRELGKAEIVARNRRNKPFSFDFNRMSIEKADIQIDRLPLIFEGRNYLMTFFYHAEKGKFQNGVNLSTGKTKVVDLNTTGTLRKISVADIHKLFEKSFVIKAKLSREYRNNHPILCNMKNYVKQINKPGRKAVTKKTKAGLHDIFCID
ncbi:MAG: hypothetical protein ABUK01_02110 [Leptospirales bacterium]